MAAYKKTDKYKAFKLKKKLKKLVKKPKDANKPNRPMTGYFFYLMVVRESVASAHPSWKMGQIGKKIGEMWRGLGDAEKSKYLNKAEKARAVYQGKLQRYKQTAKYSAYQQQVKEWKVKCKEAKKAALAGGKVKTSKKRVAKKK